MRIAPPNRNRPRRSVAQSSVPPTSPPESRQPSFPRPPVLNPFGLIRGITHLAVGTAVGLGLLAGLGIWRSGDRFFEGLRLMISPPEPPPPQVDVRSVIVQQLRGASELTTAIFAMEAVVPSTSDRTLAGYVIGSTKLLYVAYGEVRAGVNLGEITGDNVQTDGENLRIILPPPRILDSKLDLSRSNVFDYDRGFLGLGPDNAPELQELAQQQALEKIVQAACQENLLLEANRRAELTVQQLLLTAGFETVTVITQPPNDPLCAPLPGAQASPPGFAPQAVPGTPAVPNPGGQPSPTANPEGVSSLAPSLPTGVNPVPIPPDQENRAPVPPNGDTVN